MPDLFASACPIYNESGEQDIYRPTFRSDILRRLYKKYVKKGGKFFAKISGDDIEASWTMVARLMELSYRCTICRRCAQTCPIGVDNGLVTRELRKIFSQEMGITVEPLHTKGSVQQLEDGFGYRHDAGGVPGQYRVSRGRGRRTHRA